MLKRIVYLATAALVALMILMPSALAQAYYAPEGLPPSGGMPVSSLLLPTTVLIIGSGILAYAVLRRR